MASTGAAAASADTVSPVANESVNAVSCGNAAAQDCAAIATRPNGQGGSQLFFITGGTAGSRQQLPAGFAATGLACSGATTCVLVGTENSQAAVVSVTNGSIGTVTPVPAARLLVGVTCPTAGSCIAVGGAASTGFSSHPSAVVVPINNGQPGTAQTVPGANELFGVACSSTNSCTASGGSSIQSSCGQNCTTSTAVGVVDTIVNGTAGTPQQVQGPNANTILKAVACVPGAPRCVAVGESGSAAPKALIVPISGGVAGAPITVPGVSDLGDISCPDANGCLAVGEHVSADGNTTTGLKVSVAPGGTPGTAQSEPGTSVLFSLDCSDPSTCIAVGTADANTGAILSIGAAGTPSTAVANALGVSGSASSITSLLRTGGYPTTFAAPKAGTATISWYDVPPGATLARVKKPILVARGSKRFTKAGTAKLKIALTGQGRALLKKTKRSVKLIALGSFAAKGAKATTKRKTITLKRH